jgi:endo-1,4-beta-D-glucanase Y
MVFQTSFPITTNSIHHIHSLEETLAYLSSEQICRINPIWDYRRDYYVLALTFYQRLTLQLHFKFKEGII